MSEPRTTAGRALLHDLGDITATWHETAWYADAILAVEAEAMNMEQARLSRLPELWHDAMMDFPETAAPGRTSASAEADGLREALNMLRRVTSAYRTPHKDDPHRLDDEIAGAEAFVARAALAAAHGAGEE